MRRYLSEEEVSRMMIVRTNGMRSRSIRLVAVILLVLTILPSATLSIENGSALKADSAVLYYNEACGECMSYVSGTLEPALYDIGIPPENLEKKDYIRDREYRSELNEKRDELGTPLELQSHFVTIVDDRIILEGYIPSHIIEEIFDEVTTIPSEKVVVSVTEKNSDTYNVWGFKGDIKEYQIDTPIGEYLSWFEENEDELTDPGLSDDLSLLLVIGAGLADGINPCAFAVLLFFISLMFSMKKSRGQLLQVGAVYIMAIYMVYFMIGVGLLHVIMISGHPELMAMAGAVLVIILGILNMKDVLFPKLGERIPIKLKIPEFSKGTIRKWADQATLLSALVLGIIVALVEFPCTGAIYVEILSVLSVKASYFQGIQYLLIYNVMFVLPLIVILLAATNKQVAERMSQWRDKEKEKMRMFSSVVMIVLGIGILVWLFI